MNLISENDRLIYVFEGREIDGHPASYGIAKDQVELMGERGQTVRIAHLFLIVEPGLPTCTTVFQGIKRPCKADNDMDGGEKKRVLILTTAHDYAWPKSGRFEAEEGIKEFAAPLGMVYFVIASPNSQKETYPRVDYWLEHWAWVEADPSDLTLPKEFHLRYEEKLG